MSVRVPAPRTPDPAAAPPLRWGVPGTGWIAERVASVLAPTAQRFVAMGSRDRSRAAAFADRFGIGTAYRADLVADPWIGVVDGVPKRLT